MSAGDIKDKFSIMRLKFELRISESHGEAADDDGLDSLAFRDLFFVGGDLIELGVEPTDDEYCFENSSPPGANLPRFRG